MRRYGYPPLSTAAAFHRSSSSACHTSPPGAPPCAARRPILLVSSDAEACRAPSKNRPAGCRRGRGRHGRARGGRRLRACAVHLGAAPAQLGRAVPGHRGATPPPGVRAPRPLRRGPSRRAGALRAGPLPGSPPLPARRLLPRRRRRAGPHGGRPQRDVPRGAPRRLRHGQRLRAPLRGLRHRPGDGGRGRPAQEYRPPHLRRRHPGRRLGVHRAARVLQARRVRARPRPRPPQRREPALEPLPPLLRGQLQDEVPAARLPGDGRRRVPAGPHHLQHPRRRVLQDVHVLGPPPHRRPHAPRRRRAGHRHARLLRRRLHGAPARAQHLLRVSPARRRRQARRGHGRHRVRGVRQGGIPRHLRDAARGRWREAAVDLLQLARSLPAEAAQEKPNLLELLILIRSAQHRCSVMETMYSVMMLYAWKKNHDVMESMEEPI